MIQTLIICLSFLTISLALYEDQVGKFDWRKQFIGNVHAGQLSADATSAAHEKLFVNTDENVVASINTKNGDLIWRQIMEKSKYKFLLLRAHDILVITGEKNHLVQSLDPYRGSLRWSWAFSNECLKKVHLTDIESKFAIVYVCGQLYSLDNTGELIWSTTLNKDTDVDFADFLYRKDSSEIFGIGSKKRETIHVVTVNAKTGSVIGEFGSSKEESVDKCSVFGQEILCGNFASGSIYSIDMTDGAMIIGTVLKVETSIKSFIPLSKQYFALIDKEQHGQVYKVEIGNANALFQETFPKVLDIKSTMYENTLYVVMAVDENDKRKIRWFDIAKGVEIQKATLEFSDSAELNGIKQIFPIIVSKDDSTSLIYRVVIQGEDHALAAFEHSTGGRPAWIRQEALSQILGVEMLDLPLSESQASVESEFSTNGESLTSMFTKRLTSQARQIQRAILRMVNETLIVLGAMGSANSPADWYYILKGASLPHHHAAALAPFERDYFNLHKIIVAVTSNGKIFGLDNRQGRILWQLYNADILPFVNDDAQKNVPLFVLRTTGHFPYPALCAVVGMQKKTNNAYLILFDPVAGIVKDSLILDVPAKQVILLPVETEEESHGLAILDTKNEVHIYPKTIRNVLQSTLQVKSFFIFNIDRQHGTTIGYKFLDVNLASGKNDKLVRWSLQKTWQMNLPLQKGEKLIDVKMKHQHEHVHSQGRVLGDRSVLYKYSNPNLVAATIEKVDEGGKNNLMIYLFDAVTGTVISNIVHRRVARPFHLVHCENWIVYSFFNEKSRRTEMAVIELYEGKQQTDADKFSSFVARPSPIVMRQSYVFPHGVSAMAVTDTEKGITARHLILSMPFGAVLELHKSFLDPRRVLNPTPEEREEGLVPYVPELPIITEYFINYNQSVFNIRSIHTAPSGLESTSCVLAYGLDLFYTRVHPSATFDILKDDFDHWFISVMLLGLFLASVMTKRLAKLRDLNLAWK